METENNLKCSISANITPEEAMKHISNPRSWWGEDIEGSSQKVNDEFTYYSRETWVKFKITELIQGRKAVWHVTDSFLPTMKNKKEWNDTEVVWEISKSSEGIKIDMTHIGLTPKMECYTACENGWKSSLDSLLALMTTGKGTPHKGKARIK